jgi:hypothetical protein
VEALHGASGSAQHPKGCERLNSPALARETALVNPVVSAGTARYSRRVVYYSRKFNRPGLYDLKEKKGFERQFGVVPRRINPSSLSG